MRQDPGPEPVAESMVRCKEQVRLFDKVAVVSTNPYDSKALATGPYRKFGLFVYIDSTGAPTDIRITVEFLDKITGRWHTYKQGLFASLYYEDTDTASGLAECFQGECLGRDMRVKLTGTACTTAAYFNVDVSVELYN
jgi:hypothetical protein